MMTRDVFRFVGYTLLISLVVAVVCIAFASVVDAQGLKPRPTPSASAPAPKAGGEKPAEAPKAGEEKKAEEASALTIVGELPKQVEGGRRIVASLEVRGGKPPYDWKFDGPTNDDIAWASAFNHAEEDKDQRKAEFVWWATRRKSGLAEVKISVSDSTTPESLKVTRVFKPVVTPMIVNPKDIYDQGATTKQYAREMRDSMSSMRWELRRERTNAYKYADDKIAEANNRADAKIREAKGAALSYIQRIESSVATAATVLGIILLLILVGVVFVAWTIIRGGQTRVTDAPSAQQIAATMADELQRREGGGDPMPRSDNRGMGRLPPRLVAFVVLSLFAAGIVSAAEPAKAPIRSVSPSVLVKEQDPVLFTFTPTQKCGCEFGDVDKVQIGDDRGMTYADFKAEAHKVTVKISADSSAATGPTTFALVRKDGTRVESGKKLYLRVFDLQTADARLELLGEIASLRKQLKAHDTQLATAATTAAVDALQQRLDAVRDETNRQLNLVAGELAKTARVAESAHAQSATALRGVEAIGNTVVVKSRGFLGIGGKKEAVSAEAAEWARVSLAAGAALAAGAEKPKEDEK